MKYLFFLFFSVSIFSQSIVTGNTFSEQGYILRNVLIINITTNEKTISNNEGFFSIKANINDELRFVKENYERGVKKILNVDFFNLSSIVLIQEPTDIQEVKIDIEPTGDLSKDVNFNSSKKLTQLNKELAEYIKKPMPEDQSKHNIPTSFEPKDPFAGQLNLLSGGLGGTGSSGGIIGLIVKEAFKKKNKKLDYTEIHTFYKKIKDSMYNDYFIRKGLNEFEFEQYVIYIDQRYNLSKKYWNNFNIQEIKYLLDKQLNNYIELKKNN